MRVFCLAIAWLMLVFVGGSDITQLAHAQNKSAQKDSFHAVVKHMSPEMRKAYQAFRLAWQEGLFKDAYSLSKYALLMAENEFGAESPPAAIIHLDLLNFMVDRKWLKHPDWPSEEERQQFLFKHMEKFVLISLKTGIAPNAQFILIVTLAEQYIDRGRCEEAVNLLKVPQLAANPKFMEIYDVPRLRVKARKCDDKKN